MIPDKSKEARGGVLSHWLHRYHTHRHAIYFHALLLAASPIGRILETTACPGDQLDIFYVFQKRLRDRLLLIWKEAMTSTRILHDDSTSNSERSRGRASCRCKYWGGPEPQEA
mmetsp:Transcript_11114/g.25751  ORF Transcript_11114/g.25751 Transcript_11114/m.25751 type:complete len:113 (+) Transcript_11114:345-683(+)